MTEGRGTTGKLIATLVVGIVVSMISVASWADELDEGCQVVILNRSARVGSDGSWQVFNVPVGFGPVRARASCIVDGVVKSGETELQEVPADGEVGYGPVDFTAPSPTPELLTLTASTSVLTAGQPSAQVMATARYGDGSLADVTAQEGTAYRVSNEAVASVSAGGAVSALSSGTVLVVATRDGTVGVTTLSVILAADTDGDGLPDDFEVANGLDPNNAADALDDPDEDGLTTLAEYGLGTDPFDSDTDGDGLLDGEEVNVYGTDPLLEDTDGDGVSDGLEVLAGSDPLDPNDVSLDGIIDSLEVSPSVATLILNAVVGEVSRQLEVTATLIDGAELDVTSTSFGTSYVSSDLFTVNFGAVDGRIYGHTSGEGDAVVTVSNAGLEAAVSVHVTLFEPTVLSSLPIPGHPNGLALQDDQVFVAAGATGLWVVDVADPTSPVIVGSVDTAGNANGVAVAGNLAFVADGPGGLAVVDVSSPSGPEMVGVLSVAGDATDISVQGNTVFIAARRLGQMEGHVWVIDVSTPSEPVALGGLDSILDPVSVATAGDRLLVTGFDEGLFVLDVSDPTAPAILGRSPLRADGSSSPGGVAVTGPLALVADGMDLHGGGLRVVDFADPATPVVGGTTDDNYGLTAVAAEDDFVVAADYGLVVGGQAVPSVAIPIFGLTDGNPARRGIIQFLTACCRWGQDVAVGNGLAYVLATRRPGSDNGVSGQGELYIGRYLLTEDGGAPPSVVLTAPVEGVPLEERAFVTVAADASDDFRVSRVEFSVEGVVQALSFFGPPYGARVLVPAGGSDVTIEARAFDLAGNQATDVRVFSVSPNAEPTVELLSPRVGDSAIINRLLPVVARATDDSGVDRVDFYVNGQLVASDTDAPYGLSVLPIGESVEISAIAYDDLGPSEVAGPVVIPVVPDSAPSVALIQPLEGAEVVGGSSLRVLATASDDVGVDFVSFFADGALAGSDPTPPYESSVAVAQGSTSLAFSALARDTLLQTTSSPEITVQVVPDPLTAVSGTAVSEAGSPLVGVGVGVFTAQGSDVVSSSLGDGSFSVGSVPTNEGELAVFAALTVGSVEYSALLQGLQSIPGGVLELGEVILRPDTPVTTVVGTVRDDGGNPVDGAVVTVHNFIDVVTGVTSSDGTFSLSAVPTEVPDAEQSGDLWLTVAATIGGVEYRGRVPGPLSPVPGGITNAGTILLTEVGPGTAPTTAVVQLVDDLGQPIEGADVLFFTDFSALEATEGFDGEYVLFPVPSDEGPVTATAKVEDQGELLTGYLEVPVVPVPGGTTDLGSIEIELEGPVSLLPSKGTAEERLAHAGVLDRHAGSSAGYAERSPSP